MDRVEFIHYRRFTEDQYGGAQHDCRGGATVAIRVLEAGSALIAVARCNPNDVFNKKVGRNIAAGRINAYLNGRASLEGQVQTITVSDLSKLREAVAEVVHDEMDAHDLY